MVDLRGDSLRLGGIFFIGAAAFVFRDRIVLSGHVCWSLLIVLPRALHGA